MANSLPISFVLSPTLDDGDELQGSPDINKYDEMLDIEMYNLCIGMGKLRCKKKPLTKSPSQSSIDPFKRSFKKKINHLTYHMNSPFIPRWKRKELPLSHSGIPFVEDARNVIIQVRGARESNSSMESFQL